MDESVDPEQLRGAARALVDGETTVALTGAGISTESGIPDFRSEGGIWDEYDQRDFAITRFHADPDGFWNDWLAVTAELMPDDPEPNAAHESLSALESAGYLDAVLTQNVDGLHQAAGTHSVVELHGSGDRAACRGCDASFDADLARRRARESEGAPRCENCGDVLKPDAVLFGERLPDVPLRRARKLARECDVMLVVGSSLTVEPAGSLPETAADRGATVVVVNAEPTAVADLADYQLYGRAGTVVPELADATVDAASTGR